MITTVNKKVKRYINRNCLTKRLFRTLKKLDLTFLIERINNTKITEKNRIAISLLFKTSVIDPYSMLKSFKKVSLLKIFNLPYSIILSKTL